MRVNAAGRLPAIVLIVWIVFLADAPGQAPGPRKPDATGVARANQLIRLARAATGGEDALLKVTSLSASVRLYRHVSFVSVTYNKVRERETVLKGKIQIEFQAPDKFRKRVSTATLLGYKRTYVEVVNGSAAWRDPPLTPVSSSRRRHVIDVGDYERSLAFQAQSARHQLTFYALGLLIRGFPQSSLEFSSEGWVQQESGKVDVIFVDGPEDFHVGLLLDQTTHLPLSLIQNVVGTRQVPVLAEGVVFGNARWNEIMRRARQEREARLKPPQRMRVEYRLADRRLVDGISLPHRINTLIDGKLVEEMVVSRFKINPRLNLKDFEPKSSKPLQNR